MIPDLRHAARALARNPGFALTAVLALALGIGSHTAIFSIVNSILLNPPGVSQPDRVASCYTCANSIHSPSRPWQRCWQRWGWRRKLLFFRITRSSRTPRLAILWHKSGTNFSWWLIPLRSLQNRRRAVAGRTAGLAVKSSARSVREIGTSPENQSAHTDAFHAGLRNDLFRLFCGIFISAALVDPQGRIRSHRHVR
jgi:hypothetical protein